MTSRDVRFENRLDAKVREVMTPKERLVTVREGADKYEVRELLHKHRLEKVLIVDDKFALKGMMTVKDIEKAKAYPLASKDDQGRLRVGAAVGTGKDTAERVAAWCWRALMWWWSTPPTAIQKVLLIASVGSKRASLTCKSLAATSPLALLPRHSSPQALTL